MQFDWLYLFHDVYTSVDRHGIFRLYESPPSQIARMNELKSEHPTYFSALLEQGHTLVELAAGGHVCALHDLLGELRQDEILFHFTDRMFTSACRAGHVHVCEYMLRRAFLPSSYPCGARPAYLMGEVLGQAGEEGEGGAPHTRLTPTEVRSAMEGVLSSFQRLLSPTPPSEEGPTGTGVRPVLLPFPPPATLLWLTLHPLLRCPVNALRPQDGYTPLHLSSLSSLPLCTALLLSCGAQVNATGQDGRTPLGAAQGEGEEGEAHRQVLAVLEAAGGVATWQEALALLRKEGDTGGATRGLGQCEAAVDVPARQQSSTTVVLPGEGSYTVEDVAGMWNGLSTAAGVGETETGTGGVARPSQGRPAIDMSAYTDTEGTARPRPAQTTPAAPVG